MPVAAERALIANSRKSEKICSTDFVELLLLNNNYLMTHYYVPRGATELRKLLHSSEVVGSTPDCERFCSQRKLFCTKRKKCKKRTMALGDLKQTFTGHTLICE